MVRTQIQLHEKQVAMLKKMAAADNTSMAEIIRQSIDFYARTKSEVIDEQRRSRAIAAAGQFGSGVKNLSTSHDMYLAEAYDE